MIPPSILRQLYVPGSLKNEADGFSFKLSNKLAPATVTGVEIKVDGEPVDLNNVILRGAQGELRASDLANNPVKLKVHEEVVVYIKGRTLGKGRHKVEFKATTKEWGTLLFDFEDEVG